MEGHQLHVLAPVREKCPYLLPSVPISTPPQQHNQYAPPAPASAQARPPTPPQPPDSLRTGFWTTTGGADWTDLELMPPDCALKEAYQYALESAVKDDLIIVFGSFFTVAEVLKLIQKR